MTKSDKIILLSDVFSSRLRKEQELARYEKELERIQREISYLEFDLNLTNTIITLIEEERVHDLRIPDRRD